MTRDELIAYCVKNSKIWGTSEFEVSDIIDTILSVCAIVPVEPTKEMEDAALQEMNDTLKRTGGYSFNPRENYKVMIEVGRVK
jgi:hypothetical protein